MCSAYRSRPMLTPVLDKEKVAVAIPQIVNHEIVLTFRILPWKDAKKIKCCPQNIWPVTHDGQVIMPSKVSLVQQDENNVENFEPVRRSKPLSKWKKTGKEARHYEGRLNSKRVAKGYIGVSSL